MAICSSDYKPRKGKYPSILGNFEKESELMLILQDPKLHHSPLRIGAFTIEEALILLEKIVSNFTN